MGLSGSKTIRVRYGGHGSTPPRPIDVAIARYAEDVSWIMAHPLLSLHLQNTTIYNKGAADLPPEVVAAVGGRVVQLPNVGKCDHTYLYHIVVTHGGTLPRDTIFVPASAPVSKNKMGHLNNVLLAHASGGTPAVHAVMPPDTDVLRTAGRFTLDAYTTAHSKNREANPDAFLLPATPRPLGAWLLSLVSLQRARTPVPIVYGGVVYATPEGVAGTSSRVWLELLYQLAAHVSPEAGHYLERTWNVFLQEQWLSNDKDAAMGDVSPAADVQVAVV